MAHDSAVPRVPARLRAGRRRVVRAASCLVFLSLGLSLRHGGGLPSPHIAEAYGAPETLRAKLERFQSSPAAGGLQFCALFAPLWPRSRALAVGTDPLDDVAADSGAVLIGGDLALVPASLAKLPTTTLAMERLGAGYTFSTRLFIRGARRDSLLDGDLLVAGGGDPFLVSERLWLLARRIRNTGIRRVTGDLVVDTTLFAPAEDDPVRSKEREISDRPYAARLSPLATNFNAAAFHLTPGSMPEEQPNVVSDPLPCEHLRIENHLLTGGSDSTGSWKVRMEADSLGEVAVFEGTLPRSEGPQTVYRSVQQPARFSAALLRAFLEDAGVRIEGETTFYPIPGNAAALREFESLPLAELVGRINRYSNNFMADMVAMALADTQDAPPSSDPAASRQAGTRSLTGGGEQITAWLRQELGAGPEITQLDGSGLNPRDRLSGSVLLRLLLRVGQDLRLFPDMAASLAVPGEDGTLRRRFQNGTPVTLCAKTGTMSAPLASGIAGFLQDPQQGPVAFVLLMNGDGSGRWDVAKLQALQEEWIREYLRR